MVLDEFTQYAKGASLVALGGTLFYAGNKLPKQAQPILYTAGGISAAYGLYDIYKTAKEDEYEKAPPGTKDVTLDVAVTNPTEGENWSIIFIGVLPWRTITAAVTNNSVNYGTTAYTDIIIQTPSEVYITANKAVNLAPGERKDIDFRFNPIVGIYPFSELGDYYVFARVYNKPTFEASTYGEPSYLIGFHVTITGI